ncbi:hypothetical protein DFQ26_000959, partial [Actinomortierella ambigua]
KLGKLHNNIFVYWGSRDSCDWYLRRKTPTSEVENEEDVPTKADLEAGAQLDGAGVH